jgi:tight adherence protein B
VRLIAESVEPLSSEFHRIAKSQQVSFSIPEAGRHMTKTMPFNGVSFYGVQIHTQSQASSNPSEARWQSFLCVARLTRETTKVNVLSTEAKVSAAVTSALPFIVAFLEVIAQLEHTPFNDEHWPRNLKRFRRLDVD